MKGLKPSGKPKPRLLISPVRMAECPIGAGRDLGEQGEGEEEQV